MDTAEFNRLLEVVANEGIEERNTKPDNVRVGDILSNGWAGNRNPLKLFMYLRTTSTCIKGVTIDGRDAGSIKQGNRCVLVLPRDTPNFWQTWEVLAKALAAKPDMPRPDASKETT